MDSNNLFSDYFSDDLDSSPTVPTAVTTTTTTNAISSPSSLSTSSPTPGGSKKLIIKESGKIVAQGSIAIWKPKSYGTASGGTVTKVENGAGVDASVASMQKSSGSGLSKIYRGDLLENFTMDNSTYSRAQVRVTFNPKFENEKSDQVGLIPRAKLLLTIGGTFFLEFGPLILIIVATFSAIGIWVYFGY
ncbi:tRNA ligase 1 [Glycine soja]|uniref:tRNA ligase 1 n=1 Tax=Glycine soja TaxID=3848 RepID=A0A445KZG3_GLYSO|nr:tRNA ligase 1 [Glycine soja]